MDLLAVQARLLFVSNSSLPKCHKRSMMHAIRLHSATSQSTLKTSVIIRRLNDDLSTRKSDFASDKAGDFLLLTFGVSMTVRASDLHLESLHNRSRPHPFAAFLAPSPNLHGMSSQPPGMSKGQKVLTGPLCYCPPQTETAAT